MGYALPAGIGAKVAAPERQNIVICGDGSFQMAMNELAAIKAADLDVKVVLFQNNTLGLVHQIQKSAPYHGPFWRGPGRLPGLFRHRRGLWHPQHHGG